MVASAISALAFYSLSSSKLPSYAFVCVPPLGITIGLWLDEALEQPVTMRRAWIQTIALLGAGAAALISLPLWAGHLMTVRQLLGGARPLGSNVGALLAPAATPVGWLLALTAGLLAGVRVPKWRIAVVACAGALAPVLFLLTARPLLHDMYPWDALGRQVERSHGPVWLLGRRAPSLTFYARQAVWTASDRATLEAGISGTREGWLALTRDDWAELAATEVVRDANGRVVAERGRMVLVRFAK
jgi:hypothetical protein